MPPCLWRKCCPSHIGVGAFSSSSWVAQGPQGSGGRCVVWVSQAVGKAVTGCCWGDGFTNLQTRGWGTQVPKLLASFPHPLLTLPSTTPSPGPLRVGAESPPLFPFQVLS